MAVTSITPLPLPPTRQDPINFAARADAFLAALPDFQIELNTLASELDSIGINATQSEINAAQSATDAQDAAIAAGAFANYKGLWSSLTGALNKPASVKHNGKYWNLLNNLANVQTSEPGVSADWEESDLVRVSGADFTGPITVPSGATGNQVPRSSEVVHMTGAETIAGVKTFSSSPVVPAGASGSQVPRASEVALLTGAAFTGPITVPSLNGGQLAGIRNKIINGAFAVNQRGYVSGAATTAGQYTLDRWKVTGTDGITFSTTANKTTVTIPSGQTLQQVIEGLNLQTGTYVLSWEGTAQGRIAGGSYGASGTVTASITGGTNTTIEFNAGTVTNVQLELGTIATPFEHRPYGAELALCQRYCQLAIGGFTGAITSGSVYSGWIGLYPSMRTTPTVTVTSPWALNGFPASATLHDLNAVGVRTSQTANATITDGYALHRIRAEAEL